MLKDKWDMWNDLILLLSQLNMIENPMFIETHRLAEFNPRGTVPVVLDLMIHDIDVILSVVQSKVKNISASGVSVISERLLILQMLVSSKMDVLLI
jgi:hypothetical protein